MERSCASEGKNCWYKLCQAIPPPMYRGKCDHIVRFEKEGFSYCGVHWRSQHHSMTATNVRSCETTRGRLPSQVHRLYERRESFATHSASVLVYSFCLFIRYLSSVMSIIPKRRCDSFSFRFPLVAIFCCASIPKDNLALLRLYYCGSTCSKYVNGVCSDSIPLSFSAV